MKKSKVIILSALALTISAWALTGVGPSTSGQGLTTSQLWQAVDERAIVARGRRVIIPSVYRTVRLNRSALASLLAQAPLEFTPAARNSQAILSVPMPDGTFSRFRIENSPVMEPGLAAQAPSIKTYRGQGIDDPTATARFDLTPAGFHAQILSAGDTVYVDPYAQGDATNYISYYKRNLTGAPNYECKYGDFGAPAGAAQSPGADFQANLAPNAGTLRTYRLALAVTGEYTLYHAPDLLEPDASRKQKALAALTTTLNRVNGIYEREVSVRMVLVEDELEIIYTNPATDPYQSDMVYGLSMLVQNQANLDAPEPAGPIGEGNYDIGHVMSTGFGGVALLESVCQRGDPLVPGFPDGENAGGFTGLDTPEGDPFDVDFVAHEMGHQFGGNHTFNGSEGSCSGNAEGPAAMEPGSGSTIQAYAGICGSQDLQPHSDPYFHVKSLEELIAFSKGNGETLGRDGDACSTKTPVANAAPQIDAGLDFNIPKETPFALTATGSDPDGDTITYAWEEYDTGPASPPDSDDDGQARPIFRTYNPTLSPVRYFPSLQYVLNNANQPPPTYDCGRGAADPCTTGEDLPSIERTMKFQVTARDNRAAGGGVNSDLMQVIVTGDAGPFVVTAPDTAVVWAGNSAKTVTWDVANTTAAPVSAAAVKISLSVDGGLTFPYVLAASTSNDGSEAITIPNVFTDTARVKVEAVGNIFYDVSNTNFQISLDETACLTNHALFSNGASAIASSTYDGRIYSPASAIDGDRTGAGWEQGGGWNDSTRDQWPDWLEVALNGSKPVTLIRVYTLQDNFKNPTEPNPLMTSTLYGLLDFQVQYWDGAAWVTVPGGSVTGNDRVMRSFIFPQVNTSRIRVLVTNAREHFSRIVEVEALGCTSP